MQEAGGSACPTWSEQSTGQTTTSPARASCADFAERLFSVMVLPGIRHKDSNGKGAPAAERTAGASSGACRLDAHSGMDGRFAQEFAELFQLRFQSPAFRPGHVIDPRQQRANFIIGDRKSTRLNSSHRCISY